LKDNVHLFKYDSIHGRYGKEITPTEDTMDVGTGPIKVISCPNPQELPWKAMDVDLVLECTGRYTTRADAEVHIAVGAKKVLISAPATDVDLTVVIGVNDDQVKDSHTIISNASCTTNCLAPVADVLHQGIGIVNGFMTTIHAYTAEQRLVDSLHSDLRRARAAALSMIPTTTGAAKAIGQVMPELAGKMDGMAIRVPTPNVSVVDLVAELERDTTAEAVNLELKKASEGEMKGILAYCDEPLVSCDFNGNKNSSIVDALSTKILEGRMVKIISWYDNEWGYSNRVRALMGFIAGQGI
jgi:glyceraldehyde 3-phosphate dehydrogenase